MHIVHLIQGVVCVSRGWGRGAENQFSKVLLSFEILKSISTTSVSSSAFWWNRSELRWQCRNIRIILGEHISFPFCIIVIFCMCCGSIVCHWNGNSFVYPAADSVRHFLIFLAPNKMTNGLTEAAAFCGNVSSIIVIIVILPVGPILTNQSTLSSKSKRRWQRFFGVNLLWQNMPLCYLNRFLQLWKMNPNKFLLIKTVNVVIIAIAEERQKRTGSVGKVGRKVRDKEVKNKSWDIITIIISITKTIIIITPLLSNKW